MATELLANMTKA